MTPDEDPTTPPTPGGHPAALPPADRPAPDLPARGGQPGHEVTMDSLLWERDKRVDQRSLPTWFRRAVILVILLVITANMAVWAFDQLSSFWYTVFFAFFIGLTMEPLVNRLAERGMKRGVATFVVMGGLLLAVVAFFTIFGTLLADQLASLISSLPALAQTLLEWVNEKFGTQLDPNTVLEGLGLGAKDIANLATNLGVGLLGVLGTAIGWVFSLFTVGLFAFYFAADGPQFRRTIASWLPPAHQRTFLTVVDISTQKAGGYVISRGLLAMISSAFHGVAFFLLDLPYWLPMALWVGLVSQFIPTIGTYLAGALPIILALVEGDWVKALLVLIVVTAYQQVENYVVAPRVTRSTLEIHPAVAFGSVIVGASLFGAMGALLAIPVVATIQSLITVYGRRYELVADFGAREGESDLQRVEAAMRAAADPGRPPRGGVRRPPEQS